jgi:hypothetical protein
MKNLTFFIVFVALTFNASAQNSKSFDVEFLLNGKKMINVQYYYINQDTAYKFQPSALRTAVHFNYMSVLIFGFKAKIAANTA